MVESVFVSISCVGLFGLGIWHVLAGPVTDRVFREPRNVRLAGVALLMVAGPCFAFGGRYFLLMGALLLISGLLRALAPAANIRLQKGAYPRWVHGLIMMSAAVIAGLAYWRGWLGNWAWPP